MLAHWNTVSSICKREPDHELAMAIVFALPVRRLLFWCIQSESSEALVAPNSQVIKKSPYNTSQTTARASTFSLSQHESLNTAPTIVLQMFDHKSVLP